MFKALQCCCTSGHTRSMGDLTRSSGASKMSRAANMRRQREGKEAGQATTARSQCTVRMEKHWPEVHIRSNAMADKEGSLAQRDVVPLSVYQPQS